MTKANRRRIFQYAVIVSGWIFLSNYLLYEYSEYGAAFISHIINPEHFSQLTFHVIIFLSPLITFFIGSILIRYDFLINALSKREEDLREANEMLHSLINSSPLAIIVFDSSATVRMWNPAAKSIFGWSSQEIIGRKNPIIPPGKVVTPFTGYLHIFGKTLNACCS